MAGNLTDFEERRLLDLSIVSNNVWVALHTVAPSEGSTGTEVASGAYTRIAFQCVAAATDGSSNTTKSNSAAVTFPQATGNWGTIVGYSIWDASTGGNMRWYRTLSASEQRDVKTGDQPSFAAGVLVIGLD